MRKVPGEGGGPAREEEEEEGGGGGESRSKVGQRKRDTRGREPRTESWSRQGHFEARSRRGSVVRAKEGQV